MCLLEHGFYHILQNRSHQAICDKKQFQSVITFLTLSLFGVLLFQHLEFFAGNVVFCMSIIVNEITLDHLANLAFTV